ncbi:MAG: SRPBCC family protein [Acidobacteria bacterium]|nr:MAG: SRPBCC family protein [Acidobacteriota bacterium]REJ98168.1 MAG: SRPBCC family protein [Acidobacteriota bacterium]REK16911.1 MAG: SRPBCC family protein [Acidobacteriota bacterium]REK42822.1 MAG: SRPBCC family protein [Acidobacteriota bacterium]
MKKAIFLILGALAITVVLAAAVIFLVPMTTDRIEYSSSVEIDAPRSKVWAAFNNNENTVKWIEGLESIDLISGEEGKPGSKYRLIVANEGDPVEMIETVTEVKEEELFAFTLDAEPLIDHVRVTFEDKGSKTVFTQHDSIEAKNFVWKALFYWLQSTFQESTRGHLVRFKNLVEDGQKGR